MSVSGLTITVKILTTQGLYCRRFTARPLQPSWVRRRLVPIRKTEGFALIDLIFVCGVIGLLASIALPRLVLAKQAAGAASAISTMRTISSAQLTYALTCGNGFYAPNLSTLGRPPGFSNEPFIGGGLGAADTVTKSGYTIQMDGAPFPGAPAACNALPAGEAGQGFRAAADPTEGTNPRFFGTNANNVIYEHNATLFMVMPEVGEPPSGHLLR
jgi:type II secretory pathway pseudopilin PulG